MVFISKIMETRTAGAASWPLGTVATLTYRLPGIPAAELLKVKAAGSLSNENYRHAARAFLAWADGRAPTAELFAAFIRALADREPPLPSSTAIFTVAK